MYKTQKVQTCRYVQTYCIPSIHCITARCMNNNTKHIHTTTVYSDLHTNSQQPYEAGTFLSILHVEKLNTETLRKLAWTHTAAT